MAFVKLGVLQGLDIFKSTPSTNCKFIIQGFGLALLSQQVCQHDAGLGCVQGSPVRQQCPGIHDPLCLRRPHTAECAGWEERSAVTTGGGGWHRLVSGGSSGDRRLLLPRQLQLPLAAGAGEDAAGGRSQGGGRESCGGPADRSSSHHQCFLYWSVLLSRAVKTVLSEALVYVLCDVSQFTFH